MWCAAATVLTPQNRRELGEITKIINAYLVPSGRERREPRHDLCPTSLTG